MSWHLEGRNKPLYSRLHQHSIRWGSPHQLCCLESWNEEEKYTNQIVYLLDLYMTWHPLCFARRPRQTFLFLKHIPLHIRTASLKRPLRLSTTGKELTKPEKRLPFVLDLLAPIDWLLITTCLGLLMATMCNRWNQMEPLPCLQLRQNNMQQAKHFSKVGRNLILNGL